MGFFLRVFIFGFFLGIGAAFLFTKSYADTPCISDTKRFVVLSGAVSDFPEEFETYQRFSLRVQDKILSVLAPLYPSFFYGDFLKVSGFLECSTVAFPKITFIASDRGESIHAALFAVRKFFLERIERIFHEPRAGLAASILLGRYGKNETDEHFRASGLSHITALSGFNITILIIFVRFFTKSFSRRFQLFAMLLIISCFVLLTGAAPSTVRAALMGFAALFAASFGRVSNPFHALCLAAFTMVLFEPKILMTDLGFQLSFLATLGLFTCATPLQKRLPRLLAETLSAQIFTTPLVLFRFGTFNPLAIIANILAVPVIPALMAFVFLAALVYIVTPYGGLIVGFYADLLLRWLIFVADAFADFVLMLGETYGFPYHFTESEALL